MARILSIDYGKKRTGIAVTDPLQIIANGLVTIATSDLVTFLLLGYGRALGLCNPPFRRL